MSKQITGDEPANILTIRQELAVRFAGALIISPSGVHLAHVAKHAVKLADAVIAELNKEV